MNIYIIIIIRKDSSTKYKPIEIRDLDDPIAIDKILKNILNHLNDIL